MGIVQKPRYKDYWSTSTLVGTSGLLEIMSRDEFALIRTSLHFVDEDDCDKNDAL